MSRLNLIFSQQDFECPVTLQVFFDPAVTAILSLTSSATIIFTCSRTLCNILVIMHNLTAARVQRSEIRAFCRGILLTYDITEARVQRSETRAFCRGI
jgi:hypothetical protein